MVKSLHRQLIKSIFTPNVCGFLYMSCNLHTHCLVVFTVEPFVIGSCSPPCMQWGTASPLHLLSPLWHSASCPVPVLIRKQQIGVNALMNAPCYCSGLMKQSGSEMCALISCLQGWVEEKGHFPTVCGSGLHEFNQAHPDLWTKCIRIITGAYPYCLTTFAH